MKKLLTALFISLTLFTLSTLAHAQKPVKVKVFQDAFVQGGNTADEALGATTAGRLRVMKSNGTDKYSRTTYMQFNLKKIEDFKTVDLHVCIRVYPRKDNASANFTMQVYGNAAAKWNESSITFNNKPDKGELLTSQDFEVNDNNDWVKISLPADAVKELIKKSKKGRVTLVLSNDDFNKTSAEVISKERTWSNGSPANRNAYLSFK